MLDLAGKNRTIAVKIFDKESKELGVFINQFNSIFLCFLEPPRQAVGESVRFGNEKVEMKVELFDLAMVTVMTEEVRNLHEISIGPHERR
jgi:hypothetical protein